MNPWTKLLEVQALDTVLTQLEHRRAQLPERAKLSEIEEQLSRLRRDIDHADSERHALQREQKRLEDEIALIEDKIAGAEQKLYAGGSSDAKELQALQDEISGWRSRIGVLEDQELEYMVQIEPIDERLEALEQERASLDEQAVELTKTIAEVEAEIGREEEQVRADRQAQVADVDPDTLATYEQLRARLGGVAVARLEGGVCGACHLKLSAVEHDQILHVPRDEEVRCEDCGRVLVRD